MLVVGLQIKKKKDENNVAMLQALFDGDNSVG